MQHDCGTIIQEQSAKQNIEALILLYLQPTHCNTRFIPVVLAKIESRMTDIAIPKRQQLIWNVSLREILEVWPSDQSNCRSIIHYLDQCSTKNPLSWLPRYYFTSHKLVRAVNIDTYVPLTICWFREYETFSCDVDKAWACPIRCGYAVFSFSCKYPTQGTALNVQLSQDLF